MRCPAVPRRPLNMTHNFVFFFKATDGYGVVELCQGTDRWDRVEDTCPSVAPATFRYNTLYHVYSISTRMSQFSD